MFPDVNALPGAEGHSPLADGDGEVDGGKGRADVGGHVVVAFLGVDEYALAVGDELGRCCGWVLPAPGNPTQPRSAGEVHLLTSAATSQGLLAAIFWSSSNFSRSGLRGWPLARAFW